MKLNGFNEDKKAKAVKKSSAKPKRVLEKGEISKPCKLKRNKENKHNENVTIVL